MHHAYLDAKDVAMRTIQVCRPTHWRGILFQSKTGITSWDKPDILGLDDVEDPFMLPVRI